MLVMSVRSVYRIEMDWTTMFQWKDDLDGQLLRVLYHLSYIMIYYHDINCPFLMFI